MAYTLFISDLHLNAGQPEHLAALARLLDEHAGRADALYVLGDLFEAWIGDDDDDPFNLDAIALFRRFSDSGSRLCFMHGNRDFLLGDTFARQTGGTLLDEGTVITLYGRPTLLLHGDSLCVEDEKYQQFRAMVRQPAWQQQMLAKPLEERRAIARGMRMQSRESNANKPENITDVTPAEVVRVMEDAGVRHLIHGHTHRPAVHEVALAAGVGHRYVLGDWGRTLWFVRADENGLELVERDIA